MERVQHGRIVDCRELRDADRNWLRRFLVPQWRQSSRNGTVSGTMEDFGSDLQRHAARQRCTGDTWKRETTNIRLRMDSRNPCRNCTDFRIGNGLISPLQGEPSGSWRKISLIAPNRGF